MSDLDSGTSARSLLRCAKPSYNRFKERGELTALDEALRLARHALELCPHGNSDRYYPMHEVARYLSERFDQLGELSDLEEAIAFQRRVLELYPPGNNTRGVFLRNLAGSLSKRFRQLGNLADMDEAVFLGRSALELCPPGHSKRGSSLENVAFHLTCRFQYLGALTDIEEAISLRRIALNLRPPAHSQRHVTLGNLSVDLSQRYKFLEELPDLEDALTLQRAALELRPEGHPDRTLSLGYTAEFLHLRFKRLAELSNLEEALALQRAALELRPGKHPRRAAALNNIASCLFTRFKTSGALSDLDEVFHLEQNALELRPNGHPNRADSLGSLARYFHARFTHKSNIEDLEETFNLYSQLSDPLHTAFLADVQCANQWTQVAEEHKHSSTILAYQTFMRLAGRYLAILPSPPQHLSQLKQLTQSTAVDAFSAGLRFYSPSMAIELLEQGRGIFWRQLVRLRSPLDDVRAYGEKGKELADKFTRAAGLLSRGALYGSNSYPWHDRAFHLNKQLQDVISDIRKLPGLSRFLHPLSFSDLRVAAVNGPVIIVNASQYGCDAVILLIDRRPIHIPLQITSVRVAKLSSTIRSLIRLAKIHEVSMSQFVPYLRELWDFVASPIVKVLKKSRCLSGSRIWWCPTGEFSLIPLHAAGSYRKDDFNFSDHYISSYTPTLTALIRARQRLWVSPLVEEHRFLIVGQAQAAGEQKLISVETELSNIAKRVGCSTTVTLVQGEEARIERVGEELNNTHMAHFACHGIANEKRPFESGFGLGDGLLKIEKIMQYDLENAQFAYLSACHTTVGDQDNPDEAIHLAAAMQFAGFGSVIGTMWAVDDSLTDGITSKFYDYMKDEDGNLDPSRAAKALHLTMRSLFVRGSKVPFDQRIVYIHIGP